MMYKVTYITPDEFIQVDYIRAVRGIVIKEELLLLIGQLGNEIGVYKISSLISCVNISYLEESEDDE